jgi:hypothetical protein
VSPRAQKPNSSYYRMDPVGPIQGYGHGRDTIKRRPSERQQVGTEATGREAEARAHRIFALAWARGWQGSPPVYIVLPHRTRISPSQCATVSGSPGHLHLTQITSTRRPLAMDSDYGVPRELSEVQKKRALYQPELPPCLQVCIMPPHCRRYLPCVRHCLSSGRQA